MTHLEVRQKYSAARRIFNSLLRISSGDETLHLMTHAWYITTSILADFSYVEADLSVRKAPCPRGSFLWLPSGERDRMLGERTLFSDQGKGPFLSLSTRVLSSNVELCVTSFISQPKALFICRNVPSGRLTRIPELLCASHHHSARIINNY